MYFVTTKRAGYVLFCTTPSERAAIGLTEANRVHLLARDEMASPWTIVREWSGSALSHTDFMVSLAGIDEPGDPARLADYLPPALRT